MSGRDIAQHLNELSEKMDRYEAHRLELKKDVKAVSDFQKELVVLLAGSNLNGNKGLVKLLETIEEKVNLNKEQIRDMQKDIETAKFWGRGTAGILFATVLVIIKTISDKL